MSKALPPSVAQPTPGPWKAYEYASPEGTYYIRGANDQKVAGGSHQIANEADALLIASAPQLVQALQTALPALWKLSMRRHVRLGHGGTEVPNGTSCQLCEIQANEGVELNHLENCPISIVRSALRASTLSTDTDKQAPKCELGEHCTAPACACFP